MYRYRGKIHESYSVVHLRPRSDSTQYCTKYELNVAPRARISSHAWCEAYLGRHGWVAYDPTNDTLIDDRFARIGVGRDYRDVSPVRGVYKGASRSSMSVNVAVEALVSSQQQQSALEWRSVEFARDDGARGNSWVWHCV